MQSSFNMFICKAYLLTNSGTWVNQIVTNYSPETTTRPTYWPTTTQRRSNCWAWKWRRKEAAWTTTPIPTHLFDKFRISRANQTKSPIRPKHININYVSSCRKFRKPYSATFLQGNALNSPALSCRRNSLLAHSLSSSLVCQQGHIPSKIEEAVGVTWVGGCWLLSV